MKVKILIVEDEQSILKGLCDVFVYHGYEIDFASDGEEGLKKSLENTYHIIILDLMLPGVDGLSICSQVRAQKPKQPIIMLTAKGDEEDVVKGLQAGADDYVTKPFSIRELMARVETVLRRSTKYIVDDKKVNIAGYELDKVNLTFRRDDIEIELTKREAEILSYLYKCAERPVTRQEFLQEVWGYRNALIDTRTVDIHIAKLRKKIESNPQSPKILVTQRGEGYRLGQVQ